MLERFLFSSIKSMEPRKTYQSEVFMHYRDNRLVMAPLIYVKSLHFDVYGRLGQVLMFKSEKKNVVFALFWIDDVWELNHELFHIMVTNMCLPCWVYVQVKGY